MIISFLLVFLLNACVNSSAQVIKPTFQETPVITETIIINKLTEQAIITPASTTTQTQTPEPLYESTPTIEISLTPTIEKTQFSIQKDFLLEVIENNGGCDFPCVWGITPGETNYSEAEKMFESIQTGSQDSFKIFHEAFEDIPSVSVSLQYFTHSPDIQESARAIFDYLEDEKTIVFVSFGYSKYIYHANSEIETKNISDLPINQILSEYKLSTVLQNYGKPDEVYIGIITGIQPEGNRYDVFNLILFYRELNLAIQYNDELKVSYQDLSVCLNNTNIRINSWDINYFSTLDYPYREMGLIVNPENSSYYYQKNSFEETFSMSVDNFVRLYSNPEYQECLTTTAGMWE